MPLAVVGGGVEAGEGGVSVAARGIVVKVQSILDDLGVGRSCVRVGSESEGGDEVRRRNHGCRLPDLEEAEVASGTRALARDLVDLEKTLGDLDDRRSR